MRIGMKVSMNLLKEKTGFRRFRKYFGIKASAFIQPGGS